MKVILLALISLLGMTGAAAQEADGPTDLAGSQWQLVLMRNGGVVTPVILEGEVTLDFTNGTEFGGSGGCNSYGGALGIDGENVMIGPIVSTRMACADSARMTQESMYFERLQATARLEVVGRYLFLMAVNGRSELRFVARGAYGLTATPWTLTAYGPADDPSGVTGGAAPTLEFTSAGEYGAFGGCNQMGGSYSATGDTLTIEAGASTLIGCEPAASQQESAYFGLLAEVITYDFAANHLTLRTAEGSILRFTAADYAALAGTSWRLTAFVTDSSTTEVLESDAPWIRFGLDGRLGGSGGCNEISSDNYVVGGGRLRLGAIRITAVGCSEGQYEGQYYSWLGGTDHYEISDNRLILLTPDGRLEYAGSGK
ncbi:MAG: META domain-containing protein [Chloroflexi bacterium]|nr:META domain-containing protein [Chloroflexota bacterium]